MPPATNPVRAVEQGSNPVRASRRAGARVAGRREAGWLRYEWALVREESSLAEDLVRLRVKSLAEVRVELDSISRLLLVTHAARVGAALDRAAGCGTCGPEVRRLRADHERFRTSAEQLHWFWEIVRKDDHGGNRQALGQYWKIVLEALSVHLAEEEAVDAHDGGHGVGPAGVSPPSHARERNKTPG